MDTRDSMPIYRRSITQCQNYLVMTAGMQRNENEMMFVRPPVYTLCMRNCTDESTGNNEVTLKMKHTTEWVRTSNPVISSPARYV